MVVNPLILARDIGVQATQGCMQTASEIKSGILTFFSPDGAYMLWRVYSLDGFEKWTKAVLSTLEILYLYPRVNAVFESCRETFDMQKDLYYGTLAFKSYVCLFKKDAAGNFIGFQLPRRKVSEGGGINWSLLSLCFVSLFDAAQSLKKYQVLEFAWYSRYICPLGQHFYLNQIPYIQSFFDERPKEFFIVAASFVDLYRDVKKGCLLWYVPNGNRDSLWTMRKWETLLNVSSSLGKIVGIGCYRVLRGEAWLIAVSVIGNNAPFIRFLIENHRKRIEREAHPETLIAPFQ